MSKEPNIDEFEEFVRDLEREPETEAPAEKEIVALSRVSTAISAEQLRQNAVANAGFLPAETARRYNAVVLNAPFGTYRFRIGLLSDLAPDEKRKISRLLGTFSVSSIKFSVLEPMLFEFLMREAYEVRNIVKIENRQDREQTRRTRMWGGEQKTSGVGAEDKERKGSEDFAGQRLDISDLSDYYDIIAEIEKDKFNENEIETFSFVKFLLQDFILSGGSDLHLHAKRGGGRIRYRFQGKVYTRFDGIPLVRFKQIVNSLCSLAGKDPARMTRNVVESVIKLKIFLDNEIKDVEFRFESLPTLGSPSVNLRGQTKPLRDIGKVGFIPEQIADLAEMVSKDRGIVVITGPTGSGKTNTLNCLFATLEESDDTVILELGSPVEIESDRRVQITIPDAPTEKMADIIYQTLFKACMRFDPDTIGFTEIRSADEARISFRAANTGHLVFTTLHAADVEETLGTVFGWNIDRSIVSKGILGIVAQTLIRKLCEFCKIEDSEASALAGHAVFREHEAGCPECTEGFAGRTVVAEILYFNDDVRKMIVDGYKPSEIAEAAVRRGYMIPLKRIALRKLNEGITSESEVKQLIELRTEINSDIVTEISVFDADEIDFGLPVQEAEFEDPGI